MGRKAGEARRARVARCRCDACERDGEVEGRKGGGRDRQQCRCMGVKAEVLKPSAVIKNGPCLGSLPLSVAGSSHGKRGLSTNSGGFQNAAAGANSHLQSLQQGTREAFLGLSQPTPCAAQICLSPRFREQGLPRASIPKGNSEERRNREVVGLATAPVNAVTPILPGALNSLGRCYLVVSPNLRSSG